MDFLQKLSHQHTGVRAKQDRKLEDFVFRLWSDDCDIGLHNRSEDRTNGGCQHLEQSFMSGSSHSLPGRSVAMVIG